MTQLLSDFVQVIRSKNAGPFELTFDLIFKDQQSFDKINEGNFITIEKISQLYGITEDKVLAIEKYTPAMALKITIAREKSSGSYGERDTLGAQQHAPLLLLEIS